MRSWPLNDSRQKVDFGVFVVLQRLNQQLNICLLGRLHARRSLIDLSLRIQDRDHKEDSFRSRAQGPPYRPRVLVQGTHGQRQRAGSNIIGGRITQEKAPAGPVALAGQSQQDLLISNHFRDSVGGPENAGVGWFDSVRDHQVLSTLAIAQLNNLCARMFLFAPLCA